MPPKSDKEVMEGRSRFTFAALAPTDDNRTQTHAHTRAPLAALTPTDEHYMRSSERSRKAAVVAKMSQHVVRASMTSELVRRQS